MVRFLLWCLLDTSAENLELQQALDRLEVLLSSARRHVDSARVRERSWNTRERVRFSFPLPVETPAISFAFKWMFYSVMFYFVVRSSARRWTRKI